MKKIVSLLGVVVLYTNVASADIYTDYGEYTENYTYPEEYNIYEEQQTVYNEIPVQSYYAYPDDQNFIPETEFMEMEDDFNYDEYMYDVRSSKYEQSGGVEFAEKPVVICRDFGCTRLNDRITKTFLFNSLANMFMTNAHSRIYICEADPFSRGCLQSGISIPVRSGIANAMVKIPKATISQVNLSTGLSSADISMTYEMLINGIDRMCEPTVMNITVPDSSHITLFNKEFSCNMTSDGSSNISLLLSIDYIDLDYGLIGGYYSLGMQGSTRGSGRGYALFKTEFTTNGMKYRSNNGNLGTVVKQRLRPGEYAVEALRK